MSEEKNSDSGNIALKSEVIQKIRSEITRMFALWSVMSFIFLITIAVSGWWFYLKPHIIQLVGGVPESAVIAFDLNTGCPPGWEIVAEAVSRTIVGASAGGGDREVQLDENNRPLTARIYRRSAGEEKHTLSLDEMPTHNHGMNSRYGFLLRFNYTNTAAHVNYELGRDNLANIVEQIQIRADGRDIAHNNMPPYIPFFYCKRK